MSQSVASPSAGLSEESREFLSVLVRTASPTGFEQNVQRKIFDRFKNIAHLLEPDVHGNLILAINPDAKPRVMLAGHCDQIGFLVKYISPDGYIYLDPLGGTDSGVLPGEHLVIHTLAGPVEGVIGRKPVHLQKGAEMQQIPEKNKIWLDIGARDQEEAEKVVKVGDCATFPLRVTELLNNRLAAPALDNKAGLFVCLEVLRQCAERGCTAGLYVVSTVQEEIGSRGAATATSKLSPDIGIAVDTIPATDDPGYDLPPQEYYPCKIGSGPTISTGPNTNPAVGRLLAQTACRHKLPYQPDPSGKTAPNDARMIQIADSGVAVASIGIPQRNMHTQVEVVEWRDLESAVQLLVEFVCAIDADTELRPFHFDPASEN